MIRQVWFVCGNNENDEGGGDGGGDTFIKGRIFYSLNLILIHFPQIVLQDYRVYPIREKMKIPTETWLAEWS